MQYIIWAVVMLFGISVINAFVNTKQEKEKVKEEGGMQSKYSTLISLLLSGDSRTEIYKVTDLSVLLGLEVMGGATVFELAQIHGHVVVRYMTRSNVFGEQKLEWNFYEDSNQEDMYEKICLDIQKLNQELGI